jgi:hypothetical protein
VKFSDLEQANRLRLPQFKNRQGKPAHSQKNGHDWSIAEWTNAMARQKETEETMTTQLDTEIQILSRIVEIAAEQAKHDDLHFENNEATRKWLFELAMRLIEIGSEMPNRGPKFQEELNIKRGWIQAGDFVRAEAAAMLRMSIEDYNS